jgi:sulfur-oxidizing protein SoxY
MAQPRRSLWCSAIVLIGALAAAPAAAATLQPGDDPAMSPVWRKVHASLFEGRPIALAPPSLLTLEVPARAIDAAVVPIALRTTLPADARHHIAKLYLVIDANPSPLSAIFRFTPESGRADIETRVRVDDYSHVRAIAETSDGKLYMTTRFVKASGGCSAPPGSDAAAAAANLGRMTLRVDGDLRGRAPVRALLAIQHPNHSGLAMDQATRHFTPAHYVRHIEVTYGGRPVLSADVDFSISENPNLRFYLLPREGQGENELRASAVDTKGLRFVADRATRGPAP